MRSFVAIVMLAGLLTCTGCFTTGVKEVPAPPPPPLMPNLPPPVSADQMSPQNARSECQKLEAEISYDEQLLMTGALPK